MRIKTILLVIMICGVSAGANAECDEQGNSAQRTECSWEAYEIKDKELNNVYQRLLGVAQKADLHDGSHSERAMIDTRIKEGYEKPIRNAQRAWIKFRDAECQMQSLRYLGGTDQSILVAECYSEMAMARIAELGKQYDIIADRVGLRN